MNALDMILIIILLLASISPLVVYFDATKNRIASPGSWAIFVFVIWVIGVPVYLFKRKGLIEKAKEAPVTEMRRELKIAVLSFACVLLFCFSFYMSFNDDFTSGVNATSDKSSITPVNNTQNKFDLENKLVALNGNLEVAVKKINQMGIYSIGDTAAQSTAETITKSPYSALGKAFKLTGKVYKVEELPPGDHPGRWSEILMLTKNANSPLGVTTVDYLFNGDISKIQSGQIIVCSGFFVGTYESKNSMGGTVEVIAFVGNDVQKK